MSTSEILILRIVSQSGGALLYHELANALRARFHEVQADALAFGRRSALDTVYELGALGALMLDEPDEEDDPLLKITAFGEQIIAQPAAVA